MSSFQQFLNQDLSKNSLRNYSTKPKYRYDSDSDGANSLSSSPCVGSFDEHFKKESSTTTIQVIADIKCITVPMLLKIFPAFCANHVIMSECFNEEEAVRRARKRDLPSATYFSSEELTKNLHVIKKEDGKNVLITKKKVNSYTVKQDYINKKNRGLRVYKRQMYVVFDDVHLHHEMVIPQAVLNSSNKKTQTLESYQIQRLFRKTNKTKADQWMMARMRNYAR